MMLRLIPKKIVEVDANALGNETGPSRELYWVCQYRDGWNRYMLYSAHLYTVFIPFFSLQVIKVQVYFEHVCMLMLSSDCERCEVI